MIFLKAMAAQAQRAATAAMQRQTTMNVGNVGAIKNRGRPQTITKVMPTVNNNARTIQPQAMRPQIPGGVVLPNNFQVPSPGQYIQVIMMHFDQYLNSCGIMNVC